MASISASRSAAGVCRCAGRVGMMVTNEAIMRASSGSAGSWTRGKAPGPTDVPVWRIESRDHFIKVRSHPVMHLQIVEVNAQLTGRYVASAPHSWTMRIGQQKAAVRAGTEQAAEC